MASPIRIHLGGTFEDRDSGSGFTGTKDVVLKNAFIDPNYHKDVPGARTLPYIRKRAGSTVVDTVEATCARGIIDWNGNLFTGGGNTIYGNTPAYVFSCRWYNNHDNLNNINDTVYGMALCHLGDDNIALVGGYNSSSGSYRQTVSKYDQEQGTWSINSEDLGYDLGYATAISGFDGNAYIFGGRGSAAVTDTASRFNYIDNTSDTLTSYPVSVWGAAGVRLDSGKLFICGGETSTTLGSSLSSSAYLYDTNNDSYTQVTSMPKALALHGVVLSSKGNPIIIGGYGSSGASESVYQYDPDNDQWTKLSDMPSKRYDGATSIYTTGEIIYVAGKDSNDTSTDEVYKYDSTSDSWETCSIAFETTSYGIRMILTDRGSLQTFGGSHGDANYSSLLYHLEDYSANTLPFSGSNYYQTLAYFDDDNELIYVTEKSGYFSGTGAVNATVRKYDFDCTLQDTVTYSFTDGSLGSDAGTNITCPIVNLFNVGSPVWLGSVHAGVTEGDRAAFFIDGVATYWISDDSGNYIDSTHSTLNDEFDFAIYWPATEKIYALQIDRSWLCVWDAPGGIPTSGQMSTHYDVNSDAEVSGAVTTAFWVDFDGVWVWATNGTSGNNHVIKFDHDGTTRLDWWELPTGSTVYPVQHFVRRKDKLIYNYNGDTTRTVQLNDDNSVTTLETTNNYTTSPGIQIRSIASITSTGNLYKMLFREAWVDLGNTTSSLFRTVVGNINTSCSPVTWGKSDDYLIINDGESLYVVDRDNNLSIVTDSDLIGNLVPGVVYLNGYTFVMNSDGEIQNSNNDDPTSWGANDIINAELEPDGGVRLAKHRNNVVAFGEWTTEIFYDAANATGSPLARSENMHINIGCAGAFTVAEWDDLIIWAGRSKNAGVQIYIMSPNFSYSKISTAHIERLLQAEGSEIENSYALMIQQDGQTFYILTLTSSNRTLVYHIESESWYEWSSYSAVTGEEGRWIGYQYTERDGVGYILSETGQEDIINVMKLDKETYLDGKQLIPVEIRTPLLDFESMENKAFDRLILVGEQSELHNPVNISWTDDDYQTYSRRRNLDMRHKKPMLTRLGTSSARAFKITHEYENDLAIQALELHVRRTSYGK